jgi:hypothetical protein
MKANYSTYGVANYKQINTKLLKTKVYRREGLREFWLWEELLLRQLTTMGVGP